MFLVVFISGMILIAWVLLRFVVTSENNLTPLKRIIRLIRRVIGGDGKQVLYDVYLKLRNIDVGEVSNETIGISRDIGSRHQTSGGPYLDFVLKNLPINQNDSIIDIGCGKGGALITLTQYPFQSVDGLDMSDMLISIAKSNLKKLQITKVKFFQCNAATFTDLDNYTYIYMYNPFPCTIMKEVMSNIKKSIKKHPREVTIIYMNPVCHDVICCSEFAVVRKFNQFVFPFWIYKNINTSTFALG
jgi:SAM-dependent methyltransferase